MEELAMEEKQMAELRTQLATAYEGVKHVLEDVRKLREKRIAKHRY